MTDWGDATLGDVLDHAIATNPDGDAVVDGAVRLSYREFAGTVGELAAGLRALGVGPGDRVAIWMVNRAEWLQTYFALVRLGAVLVAINTRYTVAEARHILAESEAKALVVQDEFHATDYLAAVAEMWPDGALSVLREVIVVGDGELRGSRPFDAVVEHGRHVLAGGGRAERAASDPDDMALLLFTSGTTSKSKGVVLTHRNVVANSFHSGERQRLTERDRMLIVLPLASAFGCIHAVVAAMSHGAALVLLAPFSPTECMRVIEKERCTSMYGVESMFRGLLAAAERPRFDLSSMRTGVGVVSSEVARAIRTELGFGEFHQAWGLTECGGVATMTSVADPLELRMTSMGTPVPGVEVKVVDPATGLPVDDRAIGEIQIRGTAVTPGYYQDPDATARLRDERGWLHSGDLGRLLPGGYLVYQGRLKDMIKPNGFNVSAAEVEEAICALPGVRFAALVGVPDERTTEAGFAFVVPDETLSLDAEQVRRHCAERLATFKVPKYVEFLQGDLPRNELSKVLKTDLRRRALDLLRSAGERP